MVLDSIDFNFFPENKMKGNYIILCDIFTRVLKEIK